MMLDMDQENVSEFIAQLLHSSTVTHFMHFSTNSFSEHMALGEYYAEIVDLTDQYAEAYMGVYGQIKKFPADFHSSDQPLEYMVGIKGFVDESRKVLPQDTALQNIIDEIVDLISTTIYKLRFLK